ncbi:RNase H domain-containing protein [Trichonephila clavipes]|nr:RNase H domain-containing protein [Trichonephila clavipes]
MHLWISFTPNAAVLFVDVAIQPEVRFIAKQNSLMKIGNNGNLVLGPFDESTPCLMIVLMNCQTKLRINHLTAVKSVAILERIEKYHLKIHSLQVADGRRSLVVNVSNRDWHVTSSSPVPLKTRRLSDQRSIHPQWVLSHVGLPGNELADDLAKAAASDPVDPEDHMVLMSTEIYSRAKELIYRIWVVPPVYPWYFQKHPGSAISFKGSRSYQTTLSRFSSGHLRCMNFEGGKRSFQLAPNATSVLFLLSTFCNA